MVVEFVMEGRRRLALGDLGMTFLARRDRTSVGTALKRWSGSRVDPNGPTEWRNVSGSRSRQLLRHLRHTEAVHGFIASLARDAPGQGLELVQLDPPRRASRYFRYEGGLRSVRPDAFGILRGGRQTWPFFLEWERRAVRPATMAGRLAPYLRYFATRRPIDDHGVLPSVLVVFDDGLAAGHFLRVAVGEMAMARVEVPLWVSHLGELKKEGPLGSVWRTPKSIDSVKIGM